MSKTTKIAVAQLNPTVGDLNANAQKIKAVWRQADSQGADILMTTEFSLTGYPLEDLVEIKDFLKACDDTIDNLVADSRNCQSTLLVGAPAWEDRRDAIGRLIIYNAVYVIQGGELKAIIRKTDLPNYGVFDEKRNFTAGEIDDVKPIEVNGIKYGILVCEDTWRPMVSKKLADAGAQILLSMNASPYEQGKHAVREHKVVGKRVRETGLDIIYSNQVGGQDELIFDGRSFALHHTEKGEIEKRFQAPSLKEHFTVLECGLIDGKLRLQADEAHVTPPRPDLEELYLSLVLGTRDYVTKSGFTDVVLGLSGGIDSGLVAAIAVDALGADHVHLVRLPSQFTSDMSNDDADIQADFLGVKDIREIAISGPFDAIEQVLAPSFTGQKSDVTEENIQSRVRGLLLMALSNKFGWMLLTTGNKSELSVGYCTLYGDTNGGFNPIQDVYKTKVRALSEWRNENTPEGVFGPDNAKDDKDAGRPAIVMPWNIITRPPSAELREGQEDSQTLPDYEVMDAILERRIEGAQSRDEIIGAGFKSEDVDRILKLMKIAVYKQNQSPPGVKTTRRAVRGKDLRLPIANRYNPADPVVNLDEGLRKSQESRLATS